MTQKEIKGIIALGIIGLPIYAVVQVGDTIGWKVFLIIIILFIGLVIFAGFAKAKERREYIYGKYKDKNIAENILQEMYWQGQTSGQLLDSIGHPEGKDKKVLKTKNKEVWKYNHQGGNRYGLRITLDNDIVVGWDKKH